MAKDINVLFLDDDRIILKMVQSMLKDEPFGIHITTSPFEAMSIMAKEEIKVLLCDQMMNETTGIEFLQEIKEKFPDTLRILITGEGDYRITQEAINVAEVYRFLIKPVNPKELKLAVTHAINHYDLSKNRQLYELCQMKNKELVELNKQISMLYQKQKEFTSIISHELRTPLSSIKTSIKIILSGTAGDLTDNQTEFLTIANENIDRLHRLINDHLDLSKIEAGKTKLILGKHNINDLIESFIKSQAAVAEEKGIYLKMDLDKDLPLIEFDNDKISQLLNNLINNAIKFTDEGGVTISSRCMRESNHVQICVEDTGIGIPEKKQDNIWDKFQQVEDPIKNKTGGTGLGLAICSEIIKLHNGKVWVESESGMGCRFYFILPIEERRRR